MLLLLWYVTRMFEAVDCFFECGGGIGGGGGRDVGGYGAYHVEINCDA